MEFLWLFVVIASDGAMLASLPARKSTSNLYLLPTHPLNMLWKNQSLQRITDSSKVRSLCWLALLGERFYQPYITDKLSEEHGEGSKLTVSRDCSRVSYVITNKKFVFTGNCH